MAINHTTLSGLKTVEGSVKNWVNRSDIPVTNILLEAEAWLYQHLRVREMLSTSVLTIAEDADTASLPSDFLDPVEYHPYEWSDPLPYVHEREIKRDRDSAGALFEGTPTVWTVIGTTAYVDVSASAAFSGILTYYAQPAALSSSNETNFLTTRYPTLLRRACMKFAYEFMKDYKGMTSEETLAMAAIKEANMTNEMFRRTQEHASYR